MRVFAFVVCLLLSDQPITSRYQRLQEQGAQEQRYLAARKQLKKKMEEEASSSRVNRLKIQNQWRKIMRSAKVENLRKEIEILSQNHERDVDRKDAIIQMLVSETRPEANESDETHPKK